MYQYFDIAGARYGLSEADVARLAEEHGLPVKLWGVFPSVKWNAFQGLMDSLGIAAIAPEVAFDSIIVAARKSIENMRPFVEEPDEGINEMWREYLALTAAASPPEEKGGEGLTG